MNSERLLPHPLPAASCTTAAAAATAPAPVAPEGEFWKASRAAAGIEQSEPASKSGTGCVAGGGGSQQKADWQARERMLRSHNLVVRTPQGQSCYAQGHWHL